MRIVFLLCFAHFWTISSHLLHSGAGASASPGESAGKVQVHVHVYH